VVGIFAEVLVRTFDPDERWQRLFRFRRDRFPHRKSGNSHMRQRRTMKIIRVLPLLFAGFVGMGVIQGAAAPAGASPAPCSVTLKFSSSSGTVRAVVHSGCVGDWLNVYLSADGTYAHQVGYGDSNNGSPVLVPCGYWQADYSTQPMEPVIPAPIKVPHTTYAWLRGYNNCGN